MLNESRYSTLSSASSFTNRNSNASDASVREKLAPQSSNDNQSSQTMETVSLGPHESLTKQPVVQLQQLEKTQAQIDQEQKLKNKKGRLGYLLYMLSGFFNSLNLLASDFLYLWYPSLMPLQMLSVRCTMSSLVCVAFLNKDTKRRLYDEIPRDQVWSLAFRVLQGSYSVYVQFQTVEYFQLVTLAMVTCMVPLVTTFFAWVILREKITWFDILALVAIFSAILLVIFGDPNGENQVEKEPGIVEYVLLISNPIMISGGLIAMKKMTKMHDSVVSSYINISMAIMTTIGTLATGQGYAIFGEFTGMAWFLIVFMAFGQVIQQTSKFIALKYQAASKVQPLQFLRTIYQFIFDTCIFKDSFGVLQLIGIILSMIVYIFLLVIAWTKKPKPKQQVDAQVEQQNASQATSNSNESLTNIRNLSKSQKSHSFLLSEDSDYLGQGFSHKRKVSLNEESDDEIQDEESILIDASTAGTSNNSKILA